MPNLQTIPINSLRSSNVPYHTLTSTDILQGQGSRGCATAFRTPLIFKCHEKHVQCDAECVRLHTKTPGHQLYSITAAVSPTQTSATLMLYSRSPTHCWYGHGSDKITSLTLVFLTSMTIPAWRRKTTWHYRQQYSSANNKFTRSHIRVAALNASTTFNSLLRAVGIGIVCILTHKCLGLEPAIYQVRPNLQPPIRGCHALNASSASIAMQLDLSLCCQDIVSKSSQLC